MQLRGDRGHSPSGLTTRGAPHIPGLIRKCQSRLPPVLSALSLSLPVTICNTCHSNSDSPARPLLSYSGQNTNASFERREERGERRGLRQHQNLWLRNVPLPFSPLPWTFFCLKLPTLPCDVMTPQNIIFTFIYFQLLLPCTFLWRTT